MSIETTKALAMCHRSLSRTRRGCAQGPRGRGRGDVEIIASAECGRLRPWYVALKEQIQGCFPFFGIRAVAQEAIGESDEKRERLPVKCGYSLGIARSNLCQRLHQPGLFGV